jgi:hypothetical protein
MHSSYTIHNVACNSFRTNQTNLSNSKQRNKQETTRNKQIQHSTLLGMPAKQTTQQHNNTTQTPPEPRATVDCILYSWLLPALCFCFCSSRTEKQN